MSIVIAIILVTLTGLLCSVMLVVASHFMMVPKNEKEEKKIPAPLKAKIPSIVVGFISNRIAVPTITAAERTNRNTANAILNFHCL